MSKPGKLNDLIKCFRENLLLPLYILVLIIIGYLLSLLIWEHIALPFSNPNNVVGKLASAHQNPLNDSLRWGISVVLPSLLFFILSRNSKIRKFIQKHIKQDTETDRNLHKFIIYDKATIVTLALFLILPIAIFLQKDFTTQYFDDFHEGGEITPAYNYINNKGIWLDTLFVRGAFQDLFTAYTSWKVFGTVSIGSYRIGVEISRIITIIGLTTLIFTIWKMINNKLYSALTTQTVISFYLLSTRIQNIDRRFAPLLFAVSVLLIAIKSGKPIYYFIAGLFSAFCTFYSLDTGLYFSVLLIFTPLIMYFWNIYTNKKRLNNILALNSGILGGWVLFYLFVGKYEFAAFIDNFRYILQVKDLLDSKVYPTPNLITSFRFSLPIIISSTNILIFVLFSFFVYPSEKLKKQQIAHLILTLVSLLTYRSALGRSDLTHVEYSSTLGIIVLGLNAALVLSYLNFKLKFLRFSFYFLSLLNIFFMSGILIKSSNFNNLFSFRSRVNSFVKLQDESFLNESKAEGIKELKNIFSDEDCIFSLASDAVSPYLIKKTSCDRFFISYFAAADPYRDELLNDFKEINPEIFIFSTNSWTQNLDNINNKDRFPMLMEYIEQNYEQYRLISDYWNVYRKVPKLSPQY